MALEYTQEITLDINSNTAYTTVGAKQGDNNTRVIKVHLTENGLDYNLQSHQVTSAFFRFRKPDGKAVINSAKINEDDNTVSIVLTAQTLAVAGRGYADIVLYQSSLILSTVSFIIIVMSSPSIAAEGISSNEFGYLNAVVADANNTVHQAEAWAAGTRDGIPVYTEQLEPTITLPQESVLQVWFENGTGNFKTKVGSKPGTGRVFTFTYRLENWRLVTELTDGVTTITTDPEIVTLSEYGLETNNLESENDYFTVTWKEKDAAYENNALYYKNQAEQSWEAVQNMTATAEKVQADEFSTTNSYDINDYVWFEGQLYKYLVQHAPGPWNRNEVSQEIIITKTVNNSDPVNLHFKLPQGPTGNCYFATFDIDTDPNSTTRGQIIMTKPDVSDLDRMVFAINSDGELTYQLT